MAKHYGVLTFDNRGPIKSWERMTSIQRHNARTEELPHCDPAAPEPEFLKGSERLVEDAQRELCSRGLDPQALRANGVIAHEVILTASHEYFAQGDEAERDRRLWHWVARAYLAAIKIWRKVTIVQMVLHLDEYTPHIHVVLMPLVKKVFGRRPEDGERWTLNGREITGPGEFQRAHDEYATEMKPLGLQRGVSGSGRKYRPFAEKAAEMDEQCKRAAAAEADAAKAKVEAEKAEQARAAQWADEFDRLKRDRLELEEGQRLLKIEQAKVRADTRLVFHSLRHRFKDEGRGADVQERVLDQLCGHVPATVGGRYGEGADLQALKRSLDRLRFDSVDWTRLRTAIGTISWADIVSEIVLRVKANARKGI
ncbi:plasmid recombination protein [Sphingomonas sp. 2378]|uniref:plasmid recombination protein n=1 Tax=Sphingomonas sp. 2378 TaxID=1219748 RepID=UPI00311AFC5A